MSRFVNSARISESATTRAVRVDKRCPENEGPRWNDPDASAHARHLAPPLVVCCLGLALCCQPVHAQEAAELSGDTSAAGPDASTPAADAELPTIPVPQHEDELAVPVAADESKFNDRQIEEIVVTATKRKQSLRDIPASISAITGAQLEEQGKLSLNDFIQQSPGVVATQASQGFTRISMRGISTDTNPTSINASPVGIFIGDTAFTDPYINNIAPDLSAFDLAGVQILKGPQGTLFGGAALSGAIRYELQEPVIGEWQLRGFSQYMSPDRGTAATTSGAAINVPLLTDDGLAFRFAYVRRNTPGVYADARTDPIDRGIDRGSGDQIRAILLWEPSEAWKFKLTHLSQDYNAPNAAIVADTPDGPRQTDKLVLPNPSDNRFGLDSFEVNYDFDFMRVVSLSSWIEKRAYFSHDLTAALAGTPPPGYPSQLGLFLAVHDNSRAFSQELRLQSSPGEPFQWLIGGYYYDYSLHFEIVGDTPLHQRLSPIFDWLGTLPGGLGNLGPYLEQTTSLLYGVNDAKSYEHAIFADLSYKFWDRLDVSAGARFYTTSVEGGFTGTGLLVLAENYGQTVDTIGKISERGVNPKFTATYHFNKYDSLYASVSKGFRFGGLQEVPSTATNGVPPNYKSDTLWNYEIGLRTGWFDDTLHADLTAFYIRYQNPIIQQTTQGIPLNYNVNASAAISRGLESSLVWRPLRGLTIALEGGITDAHITEPFTAVGGVEVKPGAQMPGAARNQYNASLQYLRPLGFVIAGGNVGYTYIGKGYSNLTHDVEINDYATLDAGLSLAGGTEAFQARLGVNVMNVLNTTAPVGGSTGKAIIGSADVNAYVLNQPRTLIVRLSVDF